MAILLKDEMGMEMVQQLWAMGCGYELWAMSYGLWAMSYGLWLWAMGYGLWAMGYELWAVAMGYGLWAMGYGLWATWSYSQGGDSRLSGMVRYGVRTEILFWFEKPGGARTFNPAEITEKYTPEEKKVALAKGVGRVTEEALDRGKPPTTNINIPRENSRSKERAYGKHPSMKPLPLCERLVKAHSNPGDLVLIPFAGSGSELIAAAKLGREAIGFEKEGEYIALMRRRAEGHGLELDSVF
jgi:hypothetical protein